MSSADRSPPAAEAPARRRHRMRFGAEVTGAGTVRFRLWAPAAQRVALCLEGPGTAELPMAPEGEGWFAREAEAGPGARYRFRIDGGMRVPDPASRFQPEDVHGPSEVVDPAAWAWEDGGWRGRPWEEAVLYELHVGAFSPEGTFDGVRARLDALAGLGVTAVELMPVADFPGRRGWGYDGVLPFAPEAAYGRPEDLKALVQAAHGRGLMVVLDVVYNHFGPEGNYLHAYAPAFFTGRHETPWGDAIDFEGPHSRWVRRFFIDNALYWLHEYHVDVLRLDAVHAIFDATAPDFLTELAETVRREGPRDRSVHLVLENDHNAARYLGRDPDGRPRHYAAQWNDDFHHAAHVLLTGEKDGYYADFADAPARHLGRALAEGFAWQGEPSPYRGGEPRGEPSAHLPPTAFVNFLQNHDQVGNRALGERLSSLAPAAAVDAATAVLLLAPPPPLLFMGQEWGAEGAFPFFCDFGPDLAPKVAAGRRREFARFERFSAPEARARIPDPGAEATFDRARLDRPGSASAPGRARLDLHRRLLALRHKEIVPRLGACPGGAGAYRVLPPTGVHVTWRLGDGSVLTLRANLGPAPVKGAPAPAGRSLFALPEGASEEPGGGALPPWSAAWFLAEAP